uniref:Uncharacterized protein n=1 Tax=Lactuca sativa TaxID=4236 RepID=A0A9R1XCQ5_LACSA|nr:hypothetical protein LSAT_V11C500253300 [Lactuca sativa]
MGINNVLRGARKLPIRASIDLTFNRTKHSSVVMNCNTPLPSCMWSLFLKLEIHQQSHTIVELHYNESVYIIVTKFKINGNGGNTHSVHYFRHQHTCDDRSRLLKTLC